MPSGSARVRSTSRVCGRQSASARKRRAAVAARDPAGQGHRLGRGRGLVEQRRVGDVEPGQVADHRLEVQQRLEAALGDLRLVGRVRGVPGRVLQHVPADDRGRDRAVVAEADHGDRDRVARGEAPQVVEGLALGPRRRAGRRATPAAARRRAARRSAGRRATRSRGWRAWPAGLPRTARCAGRRKPRRKGSACDNVHWSKRWTNHPALEPPGMAPRLSPGWLQSACPDPVLGA